MNARAAVAAFALALLAGCAQAPKEAPMADVSGADRDAYWVDRSPYNVGIVNPCEPGIVTAEYTIGSDGRVHDVNVLRSRPRVPKNEYAVKQELFERRFDPGPDNPHGYPIRVTQDFTIDCGPGKPRWR